MSQKDKKTLLEHVSFAIKFWLKKKGWNQTELAKTAGIGDSTISEIIGIKKTYSLRTYSKITSAFGFKDLWQFIESANFKGYGSIADDNENSKILNRLKKFKNPDEVLNYLDKIFEIEKESLRMFVQIDDALEKILRDIREPYDGKTERRKGERRKKALG